MVSAVEPMSEQVEESRSYIDHLYSPQPEKCLEALICLKNVIIGSNNEKRSVVRQGIVPHLLRILLDQATPCDLQAEVIIVLGSLAKGTEECIKELITLNIVPILVTKLNSPMPRVVESSLCCLRTILQWPQAPVEHIFTEPGLVVHLINLIPRSMLVQECVALILSASCKTREQQMILCSHGLISSLAAMLCSPASKVQKAAADCLAAVCLQNREVSVLVVDSTYGGKGVPDLLAELISRDKPAAMQLAGAKCLTHLHWAGALRGDDHRIKYKTLPTLIRMCRSDRTPEERVIAAETLAILIEVDIDLQRISAISDHIIQNLAEYFKFQLSTPHIPPQLTQYHASQMSKALDQEMKISEDLTQAAFKAYASLAANDEDIRKRIIEADNLMEHIVQALKEGSPKVKLAAVRCLHSISRSVQQLRTTFQDHAVWKPLMNLIHNASDDLLAVASSTLCNLLLAFSPSKEPILESGAVDLLYNLTKRNEPALRLNGIWGLMNMAFQAEQRIKSQILSTLGADHIFRLLSDTDVAVLMKTLGLLRNLLATKPHIDYIMALHGRQIMQAVVLILEGDHPAEVKEQALCILANIADGSSAKDFIMSNEDVLKKLMNYMMHSNVKLATAATFCVSNLIWNEDDGALERQQRLRDMGIYKLLQQLRSTSDTILFDKVKTALQQFL